MRLFFSLLLMAFFAPRIYGQSLHAGAQWPPDLLFRSVLNYPSPSVRLSAFAHKPLLIHMWTFSCTGCIAEFAKLDSLQAQFGDSLQILLINPEPRGATDSFFRRFPKIHRPIHVPMMTNEVQLHNDLRWLGDLWLDASHTVRYAADLQHTNVSNLRTFIAGKALRFKPKYFIADYDNSVPLFAEGNGRWVDSVVSYSYFFHHAFPINLVKAIAPRERTPTTRLLLPNMPVFYLFDWAYRPDRAHAFTSYTTDIPDSLRSLFFMPPDGSGDENWRIDHTYTYEIKVPPTRAAQIWQLMREDLARQFEVTADVQLQERLCWVLIAADQTKFSPRQQGATASSAPVVHDTSTLLSFQCYPMTKLFADFEVMMAARSPLPLLNETNYTGLVDCELSLDGLDEPDIGSFRRALQGCGFDLIQAMRPVPVLVIRKKSSS